MATVTSIVGAYFRREQERTEAEPSGSTGAPVRQEQPEVLYVLPPSSAGKAVNIVPRQQRGALVLAVTGDLDLDTVPPLGEAMEAAAKAGEAPVVIDLSGVAFADSTTVNVLLQGQAALGPRLRLAAPSDFMQRLIEVIGLDSAVPVFATVDDAIDPRLPG